MLKDIKEVSLEALGSHSSQLVVVVGVDEVAVDDGGSVGLLHGFLGDLDAVVDDEQGVVGSEDLVVEGNAVQILLQQRFEHLVVFGEGFLLLLDGQSVQQHLVVSFEEVVQVFELLVLFGGQLLELVLHLLGKFAFVDCAFVEGQHFLLFSLQSSGEFTRFEYSLAQFEVFLQFLHSVSGVIGQLLQSAIFLLSESIHLFLQFLVVFRNVILFLLQCVVPCPTFLLVLKDFQLQQIDFRPFPRNIPSQFIDLHSHIFIILKVLTMLLRFLASIRRVFLMHLFEFGVVFGLFGFQIELHMLQFLQILIFDFLPEGLFLSARFLCLPAVFFLDGFDHIVEFLEVVVVGVFHFFAFGEVFRFEDIDISSVLLHEAVDAGGLEGEEGVDVDEVVAEGDLVLVVGFVEVLVEHLDEGFLGVEFALVVLGVDVDFVAQFFGFGDAHDLPPVGQQLLLVEVHDLVLALYFRSQDVLLHLRQLLQLVELLLRLRDLPDLDVLLRRQSSRPRAASLQRLAQQSHPNSKTIMKLAALPIKLISLPLTPATALSKFGGELWGMGICSRVPEKYCSALFG